MAVGRSEEAGGRGGVQRETAHSKRAAAAAAGAFSQCQMQAFFFFAFSKCQMQAFFFFGGDLLSGLCLCVCVCVCVCIHIYIL